MTRIDPVIMLIAAAFAVQSPGLTHHQVLCGGFFAVLLALARLGRVTK